MIYKIFFVFASEPYAHSNRESVAPTDRENLGQLFFIL